MKIGVLLSGCGVYDGAEIQESVFTLLAIAEAGHEAAAAVDFAAPPATPSSLQVVVVVLLGSLQCLTVPDIISTWRRVLGKSPPFMIYFPSC